MEGLEKKKPCCACTMSERQRKWIGRTMRGDSRTVIKRKMDGKRTRGRPRLMILDGMMTDQTDGSGKKSLNCESSGDRRWTFEPATRGRKQEEDCN